MTAPPSRALICVALCALTPRAFAQTPDVKEAASAKYDEGQRMFAAGDYLTAAEDFEAAYALDPDPAYLYNIAQAYRLGSACAKAAGFYRKFLTVVPNPPNLDKVEHYLEDLDACAKVETSTTDGAPTTPTLPVPVAPVAIATPLAPPAPSDDSHHRLERRLGLAIGIVGAATAGVGGWFTHDVHTLEGYDAAVCPAHACTWDSDKQARTDDLDHRGHRAADAAAALYSVGGAAVIAGAVLYVLGSRAPDRERVEVVPLPGGAAATLGFEF